MLGVLDESFRVAEEDYNSRFVHQVRLRDIVEPLNGIETVGTWKRV